eukprot:GHVU01183910.1.p1 GENE.GHVU01183910.1~~GHVU01183910.1.p1  ORF type:complete len:127 (-),score=1.59 GHVU01183910.1:511-891(-)
MFQFCKGSIALVGASCSGKTVMLLQMIKNNSFERKVDNALCCYLVKQPIYDEMAEHVPNFVLHQGVPDKTFVDEFLDENEGHTLIIIDDLKIGTRIGFESGYSQLFQRRHSSQKLYLSHNVTTALL